MSSVTVKDLRDMTIPDALDFLKSRHLDLGCKLVAIGTPVPPLPNMRGMHASRIHQEIIGHLDLLESLRAQIVAPAVPRHD